MIADDGEDVTPGGISWDDLHVGPAQQQWDGRDPTSPGARRHLGDLTQRHVQHVPMSG